MFWTDWGYDPKIEKCGMNGDSKARQVIVSKHIGYPNGLTIDYALNRIWWTDALQDTIESADFNGNHRRIILKFEPLKHPYAISVFSDNIYWTDWRAEKLFRANKFTGDEAVALTYNLQSVMDVVVFHRQRQPTGKFTLVKSHWFSFAGLSLIG